MTPDHIALHAAERPDSVALVTNGRAITYAEFNLAVAKFTRALGAFRLPPGGTAAVECGDLHTHWLLLLAFERLGIVTTSLPSGDANTLLAAGLDLVLSERPPAPGSAGRHHLITQTWIQAVLAGAGDGAASPVPGRPDDPLRILRTSGTTGVYKRIVLSRRMFEIWVDKWIWCYGLTNKCRYLISMPFTVGGIYAHATACLRSGGTVVFESRMPIGQAVAAHGITHVTLVPLQLRWVLQELPADFVRPPGLTISSFGASVAPALRERALARLASEVCDMYGCNEAGFICSMDSTAKDGIGPVWPGVEVEIVDERDAPVPPGEIGRIRVRTNCMAEGYLDDPAATSRMFKAGWFYPGDLGILHGQRHLQIVARDDELMNIGGFKITPANLEEQVLGLVPAKDVGVCSIRNSEGIEEVWIGVVAGDGDDAELAARIRHAFRTAKLGNIYVVKLAAIPRNPTGKIQRNLLKSALAQAAGLAIDGARH